MSSLRKAWSNLMDEIRLASIVAHAESEYSRVRGRRNLLVHLGCGSELKEGWVNLDLNLAGTVPAIPEGWTPETQFIMYDLRRGVLPFDDCSCALIYSSHFFEHLELDDGLRLMRDCYRALQPGGRFRAAMPNFPNMFRAYVTADRSYFEGVDVAAVFPNLPPDTHSLIDQLNYGVYQYGEHKALYDQDKMCRVLQHVGFSSVEITDFREGIDPSSDLRRRYSFYVEAEKPAGNATVGRCVQDLNEIIGAARRPIVDDDLSLQNAIENHSEWKTIDRLVSLYETLAGISQGHEAADVLRARIFRSPHKSSPDIPADFHPVRYLACHQDLYEAGVDPFEHYVRHGKREGRGWK